jgi:phosphoribosyl 1,2-cyclic phosphodiesterase
LLRFASLGSGSSGNCLVAEAAGTLVMLDCGLTLTETERRLARLGVEPSRVSAILVTHEHGDHADGAFTFAAAHNVTLYLTHGTLAAMKADGRATDGVRLVIVNGRQSFFVDGMQVLPFTVPHDAREPVQYVLSDGAVKLGVITDAGIPTPHLQQSLSGLDALVLECNYDHDMLWGGGYPRWLKERIGGPFGHLDNRDSERLLAALDRSKLKHVIGAHLSQQNNKPALARAALARAMGCAEDWIGIADKDDGFAWRSI